MSKWRTTRIWRWYLIAGATTLIVAACGSATTGTSTSGPEDGVTSQPPSPTSQAPAEPPTRQELDDLIVAVTERDETSIVEKIGANGDPSFMPFLIELLRFPWLLDSDVEKAMFSSLAQMSGQSFEELTLEQRGWRYWIDWLSKNPEVRPPVEFAQWKGLLLSTVVNPNLGIFFPENVTARIPLEQIVWGGVARDGIPDLIDPGIITADLVDFLEPPDRIFGVSINGEHRAYPLRIMNLHEMANDTLGGIPIAFTYCTLCGAGIVYERVINGEAVEFGTSGLLYLSNKLMYDRKTNTLWRQFLGEPVVGELADSGIKLRSFPVILTSWGEWIQEHPNTTVLDVFTGLYPKSAYLSEDDETSAYFNYRASGATAYPVGEVDDILSDKTQIFGLSINGQARAYPPLQLFVNEVINDTLGGVNIVIVTRGSVGSARAYERGDHEFTLEEATRGENRTITIKDQEGGLWRLAEDSIFRLDDPAVRLPRVVGQPSYWFGWFSSLPNTGVYGVEPAS